MKKIIALLLTFVVALCTACAGELTPKEFFDAFKEKTQEYSTNYQNFSSFIDSSSYNIAKDYIEKTKIALDDITAMKYPSKYSADFAEILNQAKKERDYLDLLIRFCDLAKLGDAISDSQLVEFNKVVKGMNEYVDGLSEASFAKSVGALTLKVKKDINE